MHTIDTKDDAYVGFELLTDKVRQKKISFGVHAADGYRFKYDAAIAWDDIEPAPAEVADVASYLNITNAQSKAYILDTMAEMQSLFLSSDKLKYNAKKEVSEMSDDSTTEEIRVVYEKHKALFVAEMGG